MRARDFSTKPRRPRSGISLALVGALALSVAAQQTWSARAELRRAQTRVLEARRDVVAARERVKRLEARSESDQAAIVQAFAATGSPPSRVLHDMIALMPPGVRFDNFQLTYGRDVAVEAQVVARRVADYDEFLDRLAASSRFGSVHPGPETREAELRAGVRAVYHPGSSQ
jgi:multidrug resistance efflux pump